jgi:hypothetical protein
MLGDGGWRGVTVPPAMAMAADTRVILGVNRVCLGVCHGGILSLAVVSGVPHEDVCGVLVRSSLYSLFPLS